MSEVTTVGSLMINEALPEDMRKLQHVLDKKGMHKLFTELHEKHPDKYVDVLQNLSKLGQTFGWTEGVSVSLSGLRNPAGKEAVLSPVKAKIKQLLADDSLSDEDRKNAIINELLPAISKVQDNALEDSVANNSPFAHQVVSGARGKKSDISSLRGADLLTADQRDRLLPIPLTRSYSEGYTPAQYFASSYGQRKNMLATKIATADAGFLSKQLSNSVHRQVVTKDRPDATRLTVGFPVNATEKDNIGAVLAKDVDGIPAGTVLTPKHLDQFKDNEIDEILIHSPITEITEDGGLSAWSVGKRTRRGLHQIGDAAGLQAAQAIGEKLSQGMLSSKHGNAVKTRQSKAGFEYLNRLIQAPDHFPEAGPLAEVDGIVTDIKKAPQGGHIITVGKHTHYVHQDLNPTVKIGDTLDAGDELSDGVPHPKDLVRLKGLGEARRIYTKNLQEALANSGIEANRRNVESLASGILNWATVTNPDGIGEHVCEDIVPVGKLVSAYKPRADAVETDVKQSIGKYLDEPALHYTPGTRITKKVAEHLNKWGIPKAYVHHNRPDFEPTMVRGLLSVYHDPDWQTRLAGFYTASAFQKSLHRGLSSDTSSTSFVPALAEGSVLGSKLTSLGKYGQVQSLGKDT